MISSRSISDQKDTELRKLIDTFSRNYKLFIISILISLGGVFLINSFMIPVYKISSSLLIKEESQKQGGNVKDFLNSNLFGIDQNFQNELWVLKSSPIIEQTINNLNLCVDYYLKKSFQYIPNYAETPIRVSLLPNHVQPVGLHFNISIHDQNNFEIEASGKNVSFVNINTGETVNKKKTWNFRQACKFGKLIETPDLAFIVEFDKINRTYYKDEFIYSFQFTDITPLTNQLKEKLDFKVIEKMATVVEISYKSSSVGQGIDIVNEIMNVYSQQNLGRKNYIAEMTIDYIEKQLDQISDSLSNTEQNLQLFRSSNQLLNVTEQATGISAQYMDLQNKLAELVTRKRYYDYVADYLVKNEDFSNIIVPSSMGISDQLLNGLMTELVTAQTKRNNLIQNKQELNPLVQKLTIQIDNIRKTISENISAVQKTTDIELDEMNKRIRKVEGEISRLPGTQRQLGGIERKYRLNDAIYNYLLEKRAEAKITQASNMPDNMVIEPAKMVGTKPVFPDKQINLVIAFFLGLAAPFGYLGIKKATSNKIDSSDFLERNIDTPLIGKIMHNYKKVDNVVLEYPTSQMAESFRSLRTNIEYIYRGLPHKVIMITSSIENEGKSFNSLNLATSYAHLGRRTLLLDFDMRKPTDYFGKTQESLVGLSTWYNDRSGFEDIIMHSSHDKLDYIESGPVPPNPLEMISTEKTSNLMRYLTSEYDCIIMDTPPLAQVSDAFLLMDFADIKIIVVKCNYSNKKVFEFVMKDLKYKSIENVSVLLNNNRVYSDQYGYGYGYKK